MQYGLLDYANLAVGKVILASDHVKVESCRADGNTTSDCAGRKVTADDASDGGAYVLGLLNEMSWIKPILSTLGAILFIYMVLKFVWDRRKGQAGGGGGQVGQLVGAAFGLALLFQPAFIAGLFDIVIAVFVNVGNFVFRQI